MDKEITIDDWWDGPVIGLATYDDVICIYHRIFDTQIDDYGDEYFLTPIDDAEVEMLMDEWNEWCVACSKNTLDRKPGKRQNVKWAVVKRENGG